MAGKFARRLTAIASAAWLFSVIVTASTAQQTPAPRAAAAHVPPESIFESSDRCFACHNGLLTAAGEDVSIAADWRASMMANSSRDPYWQASVRREILDHPAAQAALEDECSICHMPMTTFAARRGGGQGRVFEHLPFGAATTPSAALAGDGVSCTVCHQMSATRLGDPSTFTGGYVIDVPASGASRPIFGPFAVDAGRTRVMQSSSGFTPAAATHVQQSELCASCHTLFTHALAPGAAPGTRLPEQTPFLEWQQSDFRSTDSCQSCHMPVVATDAPLTSVLGQPRAGLSRHTFRGGNFFMLRMLDRYRAELGVTAPARDLASSVERTLAHLRQDTARISVAGGTRAGDIVTVDVTVENLAGHKFPTAYPSRRAWIELTATDSTGRTVFSSGAFQANGRVAGNDNDADAARFEPHHTRITQAEQVQIYESIMVGPQGTPTTGLLTGVRFIKDNRLLPRGFNKNGAPPETAVHGDARTDPDFVAARDTVRYAIPASGIAGDITITAKLWFQPIGFRWAESLRPYLTPETQRFVRYYDAMAKESATVIAEARTLIRAGGSTREK